MPNGNINVKIFYNAPVQSIARVSDLENPFDELIDAFVQKLVSDAEV